MKNKPFLCFFTFFLAFFLAAGILSAQIQKSMGFGAYLDLTLGDTVSTRSKAGSFTDPLTGLTFTSYKTGTGRTVDVISYGLFVFFDITYAEFAVNFGKGIGKGYNDYGIMNTSFSENNTSYTILSFSAIGKFPINFDNFILFPAIGIDYTFVLTAKSGGNRPYNGPPAKDLGQFGLLFGGGVDRPFSESTYLRFTGFYHMRFPNPNAPATAKNDAGLRINLAVGFNL